MKHQTSQIHKMFAAMMAGLALPFATLAFDTVPPVFPFQQDWQGGDVGYSVPLDDAGRVLWLFGYTFIGHGGDRWDADAVANSLAIRTSNGSSQSVTYYWGDQGSSHPHSFFRPVSSDWRYRPEDGFVYNGRLYVCLARVWEDGPGAWWLERDGVDLAVINNPQDPPPNWQISYLPLSYSERMIPGVAAAVEGDYVYLFTVWDEGHEWNHRVYLARVPLSALDTTPYSSLQYLAKDNRWKPGPIVRDDAQVIMDRGATEMTVKWHPNRNRWVAIQTSTEFHPRHVWRRQAPRLEGPWSAPVSIGSFPESDFFPWEDDFDPHRYFYGAKEHTEFLDPATGQGIVTYVDSSSAPWDLRDDLHLYRPKAWALNVDPLPGGTYSGLFLDTNGPAVASSGAASLVINPNGTFSVTLQMGNTRYSAHGSFNPGGDASVSIPRRNLSTLAVQLQLDVPLGGDHVDGLVTDGTWTASLAADRAVYNGHVALAPQAGQYTLALPGAHDASDVPTGDGYGTLSINSAGGVRLSGHLADGTPVTQGTTLSPDGQWPLYVSLYGGKGCLIGWVSVLGDTNPIAGNVTWIKPPLPREKYYPAGFATQMAASGSAFTRPASGEPILDLTNAVVAFSGGGLTQPLAYPITIDRYNRVTNQGSNKLSLAFSAANGTFTGRITDPSTGRPLTFQGAVLQDQNIGTGYFLGSSQSGWVQIAAPALQEEKGFNRR